MREPNRSQESTLISPKPYLVPVTKAGLPPQASRHNDNLGNSTHTFNTVMSRSPNISHHIESHTGGMDEVETNAVVHNETHF